MDTVTDGVQDPAGRWAVAYMVVEEGEPGDLPRYSLRWVANNLPSGAKKFPLYTVPPEMDGLDYYDKWVGITAKIELLAAALQYYADGGNDGGDTAISAINTLPNNLNAIGSTQ